MPPPLHRTPLPAKHCKCSNGVVNSVFTQADHPNCSKHFLCHPRDWHLVSSDSKCHKNAEDDTKTIRSIIFNYSSFLSYMNIWSKGANVCVLWSISPDHLNYTESGRYEIEIQQMHVARDIKNALNSSNGPLVVFKRKTNQLTWTYM